MSTGAYSVKGVIISVTAKLILTDIVPQDMIQLDQYREIKKLK